MVSEETRRKMSKAHLGKEVSKETREKISRIHKGKKIPREVVERQKASYKKFLEENGGSPQKGMKRSEEFKKKMSEIAKNRTPEQIQKKVDLMLKARRGSKATPEQRENYKRANAEKFERQIKFKDTNIELEFESILLKNELQYKKQKRIGSAIYDFQIDDILIEIDGPVHWWEGFFKKEEDRQKIVERDAVKNFIAVQNGYKIYRITGDNKLHDWKNQLKEQECPLLSRLIK